MGLTNEHEGPKMVVKIKIYVITRAELLFNLCYEIPCTTCQLDSIFEAIFSQWVKKDSEIVLVVLFSCQIAFLKDYM